jgi:cbb3-type cytochrome oxidase subunit 3
VYREFYSDLTSTALPLAAMGFFVVAFLLVLVFTFRLRRRADYDSVAALPLDSSENRPTTEVQP